MLSKVLTLSLVALLGTPINSAYCAPHCDPDSPNCGHNCSAFDTTCDTGCCSSMRLRGQVSETVTSRLNAGAQAYRNGQFELAANCYKYVLEEDPNNGEALRGVGRLAELNGQINESRYFYQRAAVYDQPYSSTYSATIQQPCPDLCVANNKSHKSGKKLLKFMARAGAAVLSAAASSGGAYYGYIPYGGDAMTGDSLMSGMQGMHFVEEVDLGCPICRALR